MAVFEHLSVADGLEAALAAATHLESKHAGTVAAARALARKIDAWDAIVQWALEDVADSNARPAVPQNDNTSLGTYSRYLLQLGLTVPEVKVSAAAKPAAASEPEPEQPADSPGAKIVQMQQRAAQRKAR